MQRISSLFFFFIHICWSLLGHFLFHEKNRDVSYLYNEEGTITFALHGIFRSASLITRFEWLFSDHYGHVLWFKDSEREGHCPNLPSYEKKLKKIVEFYLQIQCVKMAFM